MKLEMLFLLGFHVVDCIIAEQVAIYFDNDVCDKCNRLRVNDLMEVGRNQ